MKPVEEIIGEKGMKFLEALAKLEETTPEQALRRIVKSEAERQSYRIKGRGKVIPFDPWNKGGSAA